MNHDADSLHVAYNRGWFSFFACSARNPIPPHSLAAAHWQRGYSDAKEKASALGMSNLLLAASISEAFQ